MIVRAVALVVAIVAVMAGLALSPFPWLALIAGGAALGWWALTSEEAP